MLGYFPHSPKSPSIPPQFKAENGVVGVGWVQTPKLFSRLCSPLSSYLSLRELMPYGPLGHLGFSCSFIPSIHISADHQNVLWSLAPKYSVCCLLCPGYLDLTIQSVHRHLLPRGKHSNLTPLLDSLFSLHVTEETS